MSLIIESLVSLQSAASDLNTSRCWFISHFVLVQHVNAELLPISWIQDVRAWSHLKSLLLWRLLLQEMMALIGQISTQTLFIQLPSFYPLKNTYKGPYDHRVSIMDCIIKEH